MSGSSAAAGAICLIATAALLGSWRRPRVFFWAVAVVALGAVVMLAAADRVAPANDWWKAAAFAYVGPLTFAVLAPRLRWVRERHAAAIVAAISAYAFGLVVWIAMAVNIGALSP